MQLFDEINFKSETTLAQCNYNLLPYGGEVYYYGCIFNIWNVSWSISLVPKIIWQNDE